MIKILIVDDEPASANMLNILIDKYIDFPKVVATALSPIEALRAIPLFNPTLLMLDIEMPGMNGFDLLSRVNSVPFDVIFTTAYDKYAIKAIRFSALDYLLKPVDILDLQNAINRHIVKAIFPPTEREKQVSNLLNNLDQKDSASFKLALSTQEGFFFIRPKEILRCEGADNYTHFYFLDQKPLLVSKTLKDFADILSDYGFLRIHKSHLVNMQHVTNLNKEGIIKMSDGTELPVSRRRKEEVLATLRFYGC